MHIHRSQSNTNQYHDTYLQKLTNLIKVNYPMHRRPCEPFKRLCSNQERQHPLLLRHYQQQNIDGSVENASVEETINTKPRYAFYEQQRERSLDHEKKFVGVLNRISRSTSFSSQHSDAVAFHYYNERRRHRIYSRQMHSNRQNNLFDNNNSNSNNNYNDNINNTNSIYVNRIYSKLNQNVYGMYGKVKTKQTRELKINNNNNINNNDNNSNINNRIRSNSNAKRVLRTEIRAHKWNERRQCLSEPLELKNNRHEDNNSLPLPRRMSRHEEFMLYKVANTNANISNPDITNAHVEVNSTDKNNNNSNNNDNNTYNNHINVFDGSSMVTNNSNDVTINVNDVDFISQNVFRVMSEEEREICIAMTHLLLHYNKLESEKIVESLMRYVESKRLLHPYANVKCSDAIKSSKSNINKSSTNILDNDTSNNNSNNNNNINTISALNTENVVEGSNMYTLQSPFTTITTTTNNNNTTTDAVKESLIRVLENRMREWYAKHTPLKEHLHEREQSENGKKEQYMCEIEHQQQEQINNEEMPDQLRFENEVKQRNKAMRKGKEIIVVVKRRKKINESSSNGVSTSSMFTSTNKPSEIDSNKEIYQSCEDNVLIEDEEEKQCVVNNIEGSNNDLSANNIKSSEHNESDTLEDENLYDSSDNDNKCNHLHTKRKLKETQRPRSLCANVIANFENADIIIKKPNKFTSQNVLENKLHSSSITESHSNKLTLTSSALQHCQQKMEQEESEQESEEEEEEEEITQNLECEHRKKEEFEEEKEAFYPTPELLVELDERELSPGAAAARQAYLQSHPELLEISDERANMLDAEGSKLSSKLEKEEKEEEQLEKLEHIYNCERPSRRYGEFVRRNIRLNNVNNNSNNNDNNNNNFTQKQQRNNDNEEVCVNGKSNSNYGNNNYCECNKDNHAETLEFDAESTDSGNSSDAVVADEDDDNDDNNNNTTSENDNGSDIVECIDEQENEVHQIDHDHKSSSNSDSNSDNNSSSNKNSTNDWDEDDANVLTLSQREKYAFTLPAAHTSHISLNESDAFRHVLENVKSENSAESGIDSNISDNDSVNKSISSEQRTELEFEEEEYVHSLQERELAKEW